MAQEPRTSPADGFNGAFPAVADLSMHATPEIARLKQRGVKVIVRYYALKPQKGGLEQKILQKSEAEAILNSGFSLAISYQYLNGRLTTFTPERAKLDANNCLERADELGQPKGSAIYFGVDQGWDSAEAIKAVTSYFSVINQIVRQNDNRFEVGIYGSGLMCQMLRQKGLAKFFWIAGLSDSWPERPEFVKTGAWNMYQNVLEFPIGAVKVDTDVVNPKAPLIGSFHRLNPSSPAVVDGPIADPAVYAVQRLVKGNDNVLREKPGGRILRKLAASKMVARIEEAGDQTLIAVPRQIKVNGVNTADFVRGYCPTNALVRIDEDPTR